MRTRSAIGLLAAMVMAAAGCTSGATGGPPTPSLALSPATGAPTSSLPAGSPVGASPSPAARGSGSPLAAADVVCRLGAFEDRGTLTVSATLGELVTIVYTNPDRDVICQYQPSWGDSPVVQSPGEHLADKVNAQRPLVRDPNFSYSSDIGTYIWGAVGPSVARVVIELGAGGDRMDAVMGGGYFLAVVGPRRDCCLYTAVAFDAAGKELARAK